MFENDESKFIYYYDTSKTDIEYLKAVNIHANKMEAGLKCSCYALDVQKHGDALKEFLAKRKMKSKLQEEIDENCFILANKYDDVSLKF